MMSTLKDFEAGAIDRCKLLVGDSDKISIFKLVTKQGTVLLDIL